MEIHLRPSQYRIGYHIICGCCKTNVVIDHLVQGMDLDGFLPDWQLSEFTIVAELHGVTIVTEEKE